MSRTIPWNKSIGVKLGGAILALLLLSVVLVVGNFFALSTLKAQNAWTNIADANRTIYNRLLYLAARMELEKADEGRRHLGAQLQVSIDELDHRFEVLQHGDVSREIPAPTDPRILNILRERYSRWIDEVRPALVEYVSDKALADRLAKLAKIEELINAQFARIAQCTELAHLVQHEAHTRFQMLQVIFGLLTLIITVPNVLAGFEEYRPHSDARPDSRSDHCRRVYARRGAPR